MCGRYVLGQVDDLSERFHLRDLLIDLKPTFNAAPGQSLPVIVIEPDGDRRIVAMRWGLLPRWQTKSGGRAPEPINARAETLAERPMFKPLLASHRCLVPATGFYEWQETAHGKQPIFLHPTDQDLFAFAGLWDEKSGNDGKPVRSFAIVTTAPNDLVSPIHNRMAAILEPDNEQHWLDPDVTDWPEVEHLVQPYPASHMEKYAVSKAVNSPRHNDPSLIAPIDGEDPD